MDNREFGRALLEGSRARTQNLQAQSKIADLEAENERLRQERDALKEVVMEYDKLVADLTLRLERPSKLGKSVK